MQLLHHIKEHHKEVYELHRLNPEATVGFRIEFLHLHDLKDEDQKTQPVILEEVGQPVILEEVCETTTVEVVEPIEDNQLETVEQQIVLVPKPKKIKQMSEKSGMYV